MPTVLAAEAFLPASAPVGLLPTVHLSAAAVPIYISTPSFLTAWSQTFAIPPVPGGLWARVQVVTVLPTGVSVRVASSNAIDLEF